MEVLSSGVRAQGLKKTPSLFSQLSACRWRKKSPTDRVSTHFLITWHNLHNTSLNEEHAEDSVASFFFLIFVHDLERLHFFPLYMVNSKKSFLI